MRVDAQVAQVVELGGHAGEVADAVAVAVGEAARVDLVEDGLLPPLRRTHVSPARLPCARRPHAARGRRCKNRATRGHGSENAKRPAPVGGPAACRGAGRAALSAWSRRRPGFRCSRAARPRAPGRDPRGYRRYPRARPRAAPGLRLHAGRELLARRSAAGAWCDAGWMTRLLASPTLARCEKSLQRFDEAAAGVAARP